jgi:Uma2 family endonuclease
MVLEVLSPHPRVGRLQEHLTWFARYGVRECWLYDQPKKELTIICFRDGAIAGRADFDRRTPIESAVLPDFQRTTRSILRL